MKQPGRRAKARRALAATVSAMVLGLALGASAVRAQQTPEPAPVPPAPPVSPPPRAPAAPGAPGAIATPPGGSPLELRNVPQGVIVTVPGQPQAATPRSHPHPAMISEGAQQPLAVPSAGNEFLASAPMPDAREVQIAAEDLAAKLDKVLVAFTLKRCILSNIVSLPGQKPAVMCEVTAGSNNVETGVAYYEEGQLQLVRNGDGRWTVARILNYSQAPLNLSNDEPFGSASPPIEQQQDGEGQLSPAIPVPPLAPPPAPN